MAGGDVMDGRQHQLGGWEGLWEGVHGDVSISFGRGECSARGCRWWGCRVFFHEVWECEWRGGVSLVQGLVRNDGGVGILCDGFQWDQDGCDN